MRQWKVYASCQDCWDSLPNTDRVILIELSRETLNRLEWVSRELLTHLERTPRVT
jgi:hypothetical protein